MKIIICAPGKPAREQTVKEMPTLQEMQQIVGGHIEVVRPDAAPEDVRLVCNEEGMVIGLAPNRYISIGGVENLISGTFFFCAEGIVDGEPDLVPLTDKQAEEIMRECNACVLCGDPLDTREFNAAPLASGFCCEQCFYDRVEPERHKNREPKTNNRRQTVAQYLDEIATDICDNICKYRERFENEDEAALWDMCESCPVVLMR